MPLEAPAPPAAPDIRIREPQVVLAPQPDTGGSLRVHPAFAELFARAGLTCAAAFLELPGEVVSGHADRHVIRVEVPGAARAFYLKRQHVVGWREKIRNRLAGFGWSSRCAREADLLEQLEAAHLPAPRWAASGTHGTRAFLLVEEIPNAIDLRRVLSTNTLSPVRRRLLVAHIGEAIARVHAAGCHTPDLTAKHVLVDPDTLAVTFLDWQSAHRAELVSDSSRVDALGALHASLAKGLAAPAERLRVLRAYCSGGRLSPRVGTRPRPVAILPISAVPTRLSERVGHPKELARLVLRAAKRHADRRSIRDQLQPEARSQRLVWLAGEAVCTIPEVAALWPRPAIGPPFYGFGADGVTHVRIAKRDAVLLRGHTFAPLGRARAWARATPWRSPGVTIGRVLFHLERYGVPAPQLLAFGQRLLTATRAEWFALHEVPPGVPLRKWRHTASSEARRTIFGEVERCLEKLHAAECVLVDPRAAFAVCDERVCVADPRAVRILRRVRVSDRTCDVRAVARLLGVE